MSQLTKAQYQQQAANCDGLCIIDPARIAPKDDTKLPCVTCPFCKKVVTAELTPSSIHCPACKITVKRSSS